MCLDTPKDIQRMSKIPYASAIGSLIYVMLCTRPNIAHVVSVISRYQSNLDKEYWISVKCIFKYLRRTKNMFLIFRRGELRVQGYTDSDFMFDIDDRKSISDSIFWYNGGVVSWKYFKQPIIVDSTIEAKYIAVSKAAKEVF